MSIIIETKVYSGNQTTIPSEFRKKHNIQKNDIVEWKEEKDGTIKVNFRKKVTIDDIIGIGKTKNTTNAVKLKKELYK